MAAPLDELRTTLIASAPAATLNAALIGARALPDFDKQLEAAFRLSAGAGLPLAYQASGVGPVTADGLTLSGAHISFLGYDQAKSDVTVRFRDSGDGIQVLITAALAGWTFTTTFPNVTGWPFDALLTNPPAGTPTFVFSTEQIADWDGSGVAVEPGQNFVGSVGLPGAVGPTLQLVKDLGVVTPPFTLVGPVTVDEVSSVTPPSPSVDGQVVVLLPDMDLRAVIAKGEAKLFFLKASEPAIGVQVTSSEVLKNDSSGQLVTYRDQTPSLFFGMKLAVETVELDLLTRVMQDGRGFGFSLMVDPNSPQRLTPAAAIGLLAGGTGGNSFVSGVPSVLQQALSSVGLNGLTVAGALPPNPSPSSAGMVLGTAPGRKLVLFTDPLSGQAFTIDSFTIDWTISDPLGKPASRVIVKTRFELWKPPFDGYFEVAIDSDMRIDARFVGTVRLRDLV